MLTATPSLHLINDDTKVVLQQALLAAEQNTTAYNGQKTSKQFSARFVREISKSLSLNEISVVIQAEAIRERGLALARSQQLQEARTLIAEAREQTDNAVLSEQAHTAILSFQTAAESYLHYLDGMHDAAINNLVRSINLCRELSDNFGQEMEFRKIHLGRNVLRVLASTKPDVALLADHVTLIAYIQSYGNDWPIPGCEHWRTQRALQHNERVWNLEEVLTNISLLLDRLPDLAPQTFETALTPLSNFKGLTQAAFHWCHAIYAAANNKRALLIHHALGFLREEKGALPVARETLANRLVKAELINDTVP